MGVMASPITRVSIAYSNVCSSTDQRKHQSSASLAYVMGIHRGLMNSPHKKSETRKMSPLDDVIMSKSMIHIGRQPIRFFVIGGFTISQR